MTSSRGRALDLNKALSAIDELWSPAIAARVNDHDIRVARIHGEFDWHAHRDTDECFFVLRGAFDMHFRDRVERVEQGQLIVAPRGVDHRPVAEEECWIMLFERADTVNTGERVTARTRTDLPEL